MADTSGKAVDSNSCCCCCCCCCCSSSCCFDLKLSSYVGKLTATLYDGGSIISAVLTSLPQHNRALYRKTSNRSPRIRDPASIKTLSTCHTRVINFSIYSMRNCHYCTLYTTKHVYQYFLFRRNSTVARPTLRWLNR